MVSQPPPAAGYPPPPPAGYGPPGAPAHKPHPSVAAVVSLVCGILLCLGPLTALPAIVAGVLAHKAANDQPRTVSGRGMGTAGIVLGILNLMLSVIVLSLAIWEFVSPEPR